MHVNANCNIKTLSSSYEWNEKFLSRRYHETLKRGSNHEALGLRLAHAEKWKNSLLLWKKHTKQLHSISHTHCCSFFWHNTQPCCLCLAHMSVQHSLDYHSVCLLLDWLSCQQVFIQLILLLKYRQLCCTEFVQCDWDHTGVLHTQFPVNAWTLDASQHTKIVWQPCGTCDKKQVNDTERKENDV